MATPRGMLAFFTHHRVAANLLMALMILAGVWALSKLNRQFLPNFALDVVSVRVVWSGASAEDVERSITTPLEQELRSANGLKKLSSTSATGVAALSLEFYRDTDIGAAVDEVRERVARVRNLPSTAERADVAQVIRYESIARVVLGGDASFSQLREMAYRMKDALLDRGIARVEISGLPEQEIAIQVPTMRLQELGLNLQDIAARIHAASQDIPAGAAGRDDVALQLRGLDQQRSVQGFASLPIHATADGERLTLGDVAQVAQRPRAGQVSLRQDGKPAVELLLQRTEKADALDSAQILQSWLADTRPTLPPSVHLTVYDQAWQLINDRISLLIVNGLGGLVLVVAFLYLFLSGRIAFWVALGIPVSFLATLALSYLLGGSINMISLFGLIMALGVIVDDAIVVAEQAQSNFDAGEDPERAAESGARRMFWPVFASSATTIAAFLPLMLVGGTIGRIVFEIPFIVVCVVLVSFAECMLVLPNHMRTSLAHAGRRAPGRARRWLDKQFESFRECIFRPFVERALRHRGTTLLAAVAMLFIAIMLPATGRLGFTFFPGVEGTVLYANASFTAGTPSARVEAFLQHLRQTILDTEAELGGNLVSNVVAKLGTSSSADQSGQRSGDQHGSLLVELVAPDEREVRNVEFIRQWQQRLHMPPGIELFSISQRVGGPPGQDIDIRLHGGDATILKTAALELQEKLRSFPGLSAIEDDLPLGQEQRVYQLNANGRALGLSNEAIGRQLRAAFDGEVAQVFQTRDEEIEVRVVLPDEERNSLAALTNLQIITPKGTAVPLANVVELKPRQGFDALRHTDARLAVRVSADVDRTLNNANRVLGDLRQNFLPELITRYGISYSLEGRAADQAETMGDMRTGALLALILIYVVLAWVFASYSRPLVIMSAIPFGITGAIVGHYVMGIELTVLSMFGIIGLSGIVINDSIILISFYQELRERGVPVVQAIPQAAVARLRAVLLTSLTTIGGLSPLLFETSVQAQFLIPMATSITFGIAFSTVLVLLVIPVILSYTESVRTRLGKH
jgi:multidrug efflux pump subunit AcrB